MNRFAFALRAAQYGAQPMPHWLIKSAIHHVIALLPASHKWNEWFQVHVTKSLELGREAFEFKLAITRRYLDDFLEISPQCAGSFTALELGTGWHPIVPIGLFLCGAKEIWTFDIDPLLRRERLKNLLNYFCDADANGVLRRELPAMKPERMEILRTALKSIETESPEALLSRFNIGAQVRDAQDTGLKEKSVDLFFSYSVLEYVPAAVQKKLYAEFRRVATAEGVLIQFINLKDQYRDFDRSLTPFNNLKYSSAAWKWLDSPLIPQTRLRTSDYRKLLAESGFEIKKEINTSGSPAQLEKIGLAPQFESYSREDLLVTTTWLVAKSK